MMPHIPGTYNVAVPFVAWLKRIAKNTVNGGRRPDHYYTRVYEPGEPVAQDAKICAKFDFDRPDSDFILPSNDLTGLFSILEGNGLSVIREEMSLGERLKVTVPERSTFWVLGKGFPEYPIPWFPLFARDDGRRPPTPTEVPVGGEAGDGRPAEPPGAPGTATEEGQLEDVDLPTWAMLLPRVHAALQWQGVKNVRLRNEILFEHGLNGVEFAVLARRRGLAIGGVYNYWKERRDTVCREFQNAMERQPNDLEFEAILGALTVVYPVDYPW